MKPQPALPPLPVCEVFADGCKSGEPASDFKHLRPDLFILRLDINRTDLILSACRWPSSVFVYSCLKALTLQSAVLLSCQHNRGFLFWGISQSFFFFVSLSYLTPPLQLFHPFSASSCSVISLPCALSLLSSVSDSLLFFTIYFITHPSSLTSVSWTSGVALSLMFVSFLPLFFWHSTVKMWGLGRGQIWCASTLGNVLLAQTRSETGGLGLKGHILHSKWTEPLKSTERYVTGRGWDKSEVLLCQGCSAVFVPYLDASIFQQSLN